MYFKICILLITQLLRLVGRLGSLQPYQFVDVVTPTDRPKSIRNRCVIEVFVGVFVLSLRFLKFFWGAFFIGLSQIFFFFSNYMILYIKIKTCIIQLYSWCKILKSLQVFYWMHMFTSYKISKGGGAEQHWCLWFRSCWNIVSKLNLAPVNFHNKKCLAMKLILYTINLNNGIFWGIIPICKIFAKTWHFLFCFGVCYSFWPFALTSECALNLRPCEKTRKTYFAGGLAALSKTICTVPE